MTPFHETFREWIAQVLTSHSGVMSIALRQRAKFEGWLKFELAAYAEVCGAENVRVEDPLPNGQRSDVSLDWNGIRYDVELKTPNTNWRIPGVANLGRPVTKNLSSIIADARKAAAADRQPVVAFVIFPIPVGDTRWHDHLARIGNALELALSQDVHAAQITLPISEGHHADVAICCFPVSERVADAITTPV